MNSEYSSCALQMNGKMRFFIFASNAQLCDYINFYAFSDYKELFGLNQCKHFCY